MKYWILFGVLTAVIPAVALADERTTPPAPQEVTITLTEYKYEPARVEVQSGKPVELHLVNSGKVLHEFVSDVLSDVTVDLETKGTIALVHGVEELEVLPGATVVLRFTPKKAGEFGFRCDAEVPVSHHESGMKGTLIVR
ncbi:MAG: cupredoxin domain-containing protein [Nitrospirota bacterium]